MMGSGTESHGAGTDAPPQPRLEIDANKVYQLDELGILSLRVTASAERSIAACNIGVSCPCAGGTLRARTLKNLRPGETRTVPLQWTPVSAGEALVELSVTVEDEHGLPSVFVGTVFLRVMHPGDLARQTSFRVDIHDIQKFMGNDLSHLVHGGALGQQFDPQALLERYLSQQPLWMAIDLALEEEMTAGLRNQARKPIECSPVPLGAICRASMDWPGTRHVEILSGTEVRFGRRTQTNDVVLRFLPETEETEQRSRAISRDHFALRVTQNGVVFKNAGAAHSTLDRRPVAPDAELSLADSWSLTLGLFGLELEGQLFRGERHGHTDPTETMLAGVAPSEPRLAECDVDSVVVRRRNNAPDWAYCWLLRYVDIGRGRACGLALDADGVSDLHARLWYWAGRFYLEDRGSRDGTWVDDRRLEPRDVAALGRTHRLRFGRAECDWTAEG